MLTRYAEDAAGEDQPLETVQGSEEGVHQVLVAPGRVHQRGETHGGADRRHHRGDHAAGEGVGDRERLPGQQRHREPGAEQDQPHIDPPDHQVDGAGDDQDRGDEHGRKGSHCEAGNRLVIARP
jgi:hypothetical protein